VARSRRLHVEPLEDRRLLTAARAAEAVNLFALDVYEQMQREQGNLFFSPLSVATALTMAYAGAAGQTAAEMEQVLHLGSAPGVHNSFAALLGSFAAHNESFADSYPDWPHMMTVSNALWPDDNVRVEQVFRSLIESQYDGHVQTVDYSNPQQAENTINSWVSQRTFGKIPKLVSDLDPATAMVLTNAVYFNGYWASPFDPQYTWSRDFRLGNGQTIATPMMHTIAEAPYTVIDGFAVLELDFDAGARGADYSMIFVLPPEEGSDELTPELFAEIDAWLGAIPVVQGVNIALPKIETAVSNGLNQLLMGLGMPTAFTPGAADFSGMTPEPVFISKVFHKATLTMNEQGTTAAAATSIEFPVCFAAGTPVMTPAGPRPIEALQVGDLVLARDENNLEAEPQPKRVEKLYRSDAAILELLVQGRLVRTTQQHPFFVKGKGWLPAGELLPRDLLSTAAGDWVEVNAVERTSATEAVYNLQVADYHTYFVGQREWGFAVWVHNSCGEEPEFHADRPFHVIIRDNISSTIAFMGRIDNPVQAQNTVAPVVVAANADFDGDSRVDGADFLAWQRGVGMSTEANRSDGDSNADGDVDAGDLAQWTLTYGPAASTTQLAAARDSLPAFAPLYTASSRAELVDAAMAAEWLSPGNEDKPPLVFDDAQLHQPSVATFYVNEIGSLATAAVIAFESIALDGVEDSLAVSPALNDDPLSVQVE
jgi:serpin B